MKIMKLLVTIMIFGGLISCSSGNNKLNNAEKHEEHTQAVVVNKKAEGEALYMKYCMACHQTDGSGVPGMYPPLTNSPTVNSGKKEDFINVLLNGLSGPIVVHGKKYNQQMPSQNFLSDDELAKIINYVSISFGNKGPQVTSENIKALRK